MTVEKGSFVLLNFIYWYNGIYAVFKLWFSCLITLENGSTAVFSRGLGYVSVLYRLSCITENLQLQMRTQPVRSQLYAASTQLEMKVQA